jgi:hypothetical protein
MTVPVACTVTPAAAATNYLQTGSFNTAGPDGNATTCS